MDFDLKRLQKRNLTAHWIHLDRDKRCNHVKKIIDLMFVDPCIKV
jgi:hypothetical protein